MLFRNVLNHPRYVPLYKIPGANIDLICAVSFAAKAAAENQAKAMAREERINQARLDAARKASIEDMGFAWDA